MKNSMKGSKKAPVKQSPSLVKDRVQLTPNYDAKRQTGMEEAMCNKSPIGYRGR